MQLYTALLMLLDESHLILAFARPCGDLPFYPRSRDNLSSLGHSKYVDLLLVELLILLLVDPDHGDLWLNLDDTAHQVIRTVLLHVAIDLATLVGRLNLPPVGLHSVIIAVLSYIQIRLCTF